LKVFQSRGATELEQGKVSRMAGMWPKPFMAIRLSAWIVAGFALLQPTAVSVPVVQDFRAIFAEQCHHKTAWLF
jgi:hypothetical protein